MVSNTNETLLSTIKLVELDQLLPVFQTHILVSCDFNYMDYLARTYITESTFRNNTSCCPRSLIFIEKILISFNKL